MEVVYKYELIIRQMRKLLLLCKVPQWLTNKLLPYKFDELKQALIKNDIEALDTIMQTAPKFNEDENTLIFAITEAREETVIMLIEKYKDQLDFHRRNQKGDSPLMIAIFRKKRDVVKALMPYSEIKACDFFRNTPFLAAAANGDIETLELLIAHPDNYVYARNSDGHTALHRACYYGQIAVIDWLLNRTDLKIGELDKKGNNGLHLACEGAQIAATRYIIAKVKRPNLLLVPNLQGKTPYDLLTQTLRRLGGSWKESELHLDHLKERSF